MPDCSVGDCKAVVVPIAVIAVGVVIYTVAARKQGWGALVEGADGRASTSKLQFTLWTIAIIYSYIGLWIARADLGHPEALGDIPRNVLIALGLSVTTATAAKGITVSYVDNGKVVKDPQAIAKHKLGWGAVFTDDAGIPDLSKIQLVAWTLIAIFIYLLIVLGLLTTRVTDVKNLAPPDIDASLMVLMGLSGGAYLGKKLTTTTSIRLTGIDPVSGTTGAAVKLYGTNLDASAAGSSVTFNGKALDLGNPTWSDGKVEFALPDLTTIGVATGDKVDIGVVVGGADGANTLPFTFKK